MQLLRRIIRVTYFVIPLLCLAYVSQERVSRNFLPYYFAANPEYQAYLEELEEQGQGESAWVLKDPARLAKHLHKRWAGRFSAKEIEELSRHILALSYEHQFPPALVLSLIEVESNYNPKAISHMGAVGLLQLLPTTAEYVARNHDLPFDGEKSLHDPKKNLTLGLKYMVELRRKFKKPRYYLAAYNIGPGAVSRKLKAGIPLSNSYYNKVMRSYRQYSAVTQTL